jgi:hypothetical protein
MENNSSFLISILAFTGSGDGTSNKHVNYDVHHINLKVSSYSDDPDEEPTHRHRLLGIVSSPDQSAEGQAEDIVEQIDDALKIYNKSPLAKRSGHFMRLVQAISLLKGLNTDHCSKEKKFSEIMKNKVLDAVRELLGEKEILEKSWEEMDDLFDKARDDMIDRVGGQDAWEALSEADQALQHAIMLKQTLISLGEDKYAEMSEEEQRDLDFFVWTGCGCHKNLNSVSGGNTPMMAWWAENDVTPPILLANRDNAAVLNNLDSLDDLTPAEQHALESTTRGGVKAASLAGAIFNHKDDKKGQQDTFKWWFRKEGIAIAFPDTSNNRYGTYCEAAGVLLLHRNNFLEFLEFVRDSKKKRGFTNMEKNLYNALKDTATLTELAVLALYAQSISHPYMRQIRGKDLNMLDLAPLHLEVEQHMDKVIDNPDILLSVDATYTTGAMDGKEWEKPNIMATILKQAPELPHLSSVLVVFFKGARGTWKRFTTEFTPGGMIDSATDWQKELAWMPATNDINEGMLGSFRQYCRFNPRATLHMFNALAMYQRNDTQQFMDRNFQEDDHKFLMKMGREVDGSGLEEKRQDKTVAYNLEKNQKKDDRDREAAQKLTEKNARLAKIPLIFDKDVIEGLKGQKLQDQLDAYRLAGAPLPALMKDVRVVDDKKKAIQNAIDQYENNQWSPIGFEG